MLTFISKNSDITYMWNLKKATLVETESRKSGYQGLRGRGMGDMLFKNIDQQLVDINKL